MSYDPKQSWVLSFGISVDFSPLPLRPCWLVSTCCLFDKRLTSVSDTKIERSLTRRRPCDWIELPLPILPLSPFARGVRLYFPLQYLTCLVCCHLSTPYFTFNYYYDKDDVCGMSLTRRQLKGMCSSMNGWSDRDTHQVTNTRNRIKERKAREKEIRNSSLFFFSLFNLWLGNIFLNFSVSFVCLHDEWGGVVALLVDAGYFPSFYTVATCVSRTEKKSSFRLYVFSSQMDREGERNIEREMPNDYIYFLSSFFF